MVLIDMLVQSLKQDMILINEINEQVQYFSSVALRHLTTAIHNTSTNNDILINSFEDKYYRTIANEIDNYKTYFQNFSNDLDYFEDRLEKIIGLMDDKGLEISNYEFLLNSTRYRNDQLLNQIEIQLKKINNKGKK